MDNKIYLKRFKKALVPLKKEHRQQITLEIESAAAEPNTDSLYERFGDPEDLAQQYLLNEGIEKQRKSLVTSVKNTIKIASLTIIAIATITLLAGYFFFKKYNRDDFDYSDANIFAQEIANRNWHEITVANLSSISVVQSKSVFFWQDIEFIRFSCNIDEEPNIDNENTLQIRKGKCLIALPLNNYHINTLQSEVTLVQPTMEQSIDAQQSKIRIAENTFTKYQYNISLKDSQMDGLESHPNANITLEIDANQSSIVAYEYKK